MLNMINFPSVSAGHVAITNVLFLAVGPFFFYSLFCAKHTQRDLKIEHDHSGVWLCVCVWQCVSVNGRHAHYPFTWINPKYSGGEPNIVKARPAMSTLGPMSLTPIRKEEKRGTRTAAGSKGEDKLPTDFLPCALLQRNKKS